MRHATTLRSVLPLIIVAATFTLEAAPPYVLVKVKKTVAPPLPRPCTPSPLRDKRLIIFSSEHCSACDAYLSGLARAKKELSRRNVSVLVGLVDDVSCAKALRYSFRYGSWPVCVVDERSRKAWGGLTSQPLSFFVVNNTIRRMIKGRPPIAVLLDDIDRIHNTNETEAAR